MEVGVIGTNSGTFLSGQIFTAFFGSLAGLFSLW
jgi:hypothetical protein